MAQRKKNFGIVVIALALGAIGYSYVMPLPGASLTLTVEGVQQDKPIPQEFAFCIPDANTMVTFGENHNPAIKWSNAPEGTRSFALLVVDPEVPENQEDVKHVNSKDYTIKADAPRCDFYHWVLVNIPATVTGLTKGQDSDKITPGGKPAGHKPYGLSGVNDYTAFMAGNEQLRGVYGGYDGPCPPWNDEKLHRYHFELYALDVETLALHGDITGLQAKAAMAKHVLAKASVTGTYTLNPALLGVQ